ncbi:MAG: YaeQ family protein [Deltaproteobacteria bacterium]|nr:YaeQ family protein [Deltaproteobacteria bacterium]
MSFAQGFYSFNLVINDLSRGLYATVRKKLARHPHESLQQLYARVLAFMHSYEEGLELTGGPFEPKFPTAQRVDPVEGTRIWVQIGCPSSDKIIRALKAHPSARFAIYFLEESEVLRFCHYLRGARTNWVERISFFKFDPGLLNSLAQIDKSSCSWTATIVDNHLYLVFDDREFESAVEVIDIWERFQQSLINSNP